MENKTVRKWREVSVEVGQQLSRITANTGCRDKMAALRGEWEGKQKHTEAG